MMPTFQPPSERRRRALAARGFTMIEVLVAIVIVSFGLLGVAGLMVTGIQYTHSAQQRAVATQLAYDMIDRIRSNQMAQNLPDQTTGGSYHRPAPSVTSTGNPYSVSNAACVGATASPTGNCLPGNMADQDAFEWQQAIAQRLGGGVGIVCRDSSNSPGTYNGTTITANCDGRGPRYAIKIYWLDDRASESTSGKYTAFHSTFIP